MRGQAEAILKRPPRGSGDSRGLGIFRIDITASSAAFTIFSGNPIPFGGCWCTFTPTVDCFLHFVRAGDLTSVASATNSWPLMANTVTEWWLSDTEDNSGRIIRAGSTDGTLYYYRSNL